MKKKTGKIKIELLSDLLVSNGNGYNSLIDQEVCYDAYGFPFIPAKRIKGCLREVAMELVDWGHFISLQELFGSGGDKEGAFQISNAQLRDYTVYRDALKHMEKKLKNPQMILEQFTYTRTQNAIDYETGIAKEGLRVSRVVGAYNSLTNGRRTVFEADVIIKGKTEDEIQKYEKELDACCHVFRRMGCERTRGFGEIIASFERGTEISDEKENLALDKEKTYRLDYMIHLNSALIVKSEAGGLEHAQDYLPGSMILGQIAGWLKEANNFVPNTYENFMKKGELICSNAYVACQKKRMIPIPASLFVIKNRETEAIDLTCLEEEESKESYQMKSPGSCYVNGNGKKIWKQKVLLDINSHHSRPNDKSIGRVLKNNEESQLYQLASISPEQDFCGYVIGSGEQIAEVYSLFKSHEKCRMGYNRMTEYGDVTVTVELPKELVMPGEQLEKQFVLKLESPLIEYDDQGRYTTSIQVLTSELEEKLNTKLQPVRTFFRYQSIVGYNRSWHMRKPTIDVWDKGTVIIYKVQDEKTVNINALYKCFLGERINEGYGEISIYPLSQQREKELLKYQQEDAPSEIQDSLLRKQLLKTLIKRFVENEGRKKAKEETTKDSALVHCMISMCKENCTENLKMYLINEIEKRYGDATDTKKRDKYQDAQNMINTFNSEKLKELFMKEYDIYPYFSEEDLANWYYPTYLTEVKYQLRGKKGK